MVYYRTTLRGSPDGNATIGTTYYLENDRWWWLNETNRFRTYPRDVRARNAARRIAFRDAEKRGFDPRAVAIIEE